MARKVEIHLIDDVDGSVADETVRFALDGVSYEIDLSAGNAESLRAGVAKYIVAGRRSTATISVAKQSTDTTRLTSARRDQNNAVRAWAKGAGIEMSDRGRIPASVLERYKKDTE